MKDVIDFGAMIYQLRTEHGLSQKVVADKIGIDISMLSKIENGERQLQPHMLSSIADLFELNAEKLKVDFLANKITEEYGKYPHFKKSLKKCLTN